MQNLTQIHCSTCSVIMNAMTTQYTCSLNGVYDPHWLVQWSCHFSWAFQSTLFGCQVTLMLRNHSCYINNGWTLSRQTPYIHIYIYIYVCIYIYAYTYISLYFYKHIYKISLSPLYIYLSGFQDGTILEVLLLIFYIGLCVSTFVQSFLVTEKA